MDLVIDANILFAAIVRVGVTADMLFRNDLHLYAPEFLLEEFEKYKETLLEKTGKAKEDFLLVFEALRRRITIVPSKEIEPFLEKAKQLSPDVKDVAYVALALRLHCAIWSNDRALKEEQQDVRVYHTRELIGMVG